MHSIWWDYPLPKFSPLSSDIKTDVLVVGGGLAGLLIAHELKCRGVDTVVIEADKICRGVSGSTTAKITSQHGFVYHRLLNEFDKDTARAYYTANQKAIGKYRDLCNNIDCDFTTKSSFAYSKSNEQLIEKELFALEQIGAKATFTKSTELPFLISGAIEFKEQAAFNPIKFVSYLAKDLKIYEDTAVQDISGSVATTDKGKILAENIIIATHFPFINRKGFYFLKMYQERSYVTGVKGARINGMYIGDDGLSFRSYKDCLLIGSSPHRTGTKSNGWQNSDTIASRHYPEGNIKYHFATQDCITIDAMPYIGRYSKTSKKLYVATGFNKWGMTSGMASAEILGDMILGKHNELEAVFSPSRPIVGNQLSVNIAEAAKGIATIKVPRCPHLGCALKWNPHERSWDCSCHGSRFDKNGRLINNPAKRGLKSASIKKH